VPCRVICFEFVATVLVLFSFFLTLIIIHILVKLVRDFVDCVEILTETPVSRFKKEYSNSLSDHFSEGKS
jgi:hypothetical protein